MYGRLVVSVKFNEIWPDSRRGWPGNPLRQRDFDADFRRRRRVNPAVEKMPPAFWRESFRALAEDAPNDRPKSVLVFEARRSVEALGALVRIGLSPDCGRTVVAAPLDPGWILAMPVGPE